MKKLSLGIFLAILLAACAPGDFQVPQSPALRFLEKKSGLIAFIGNDGNLYITDQSGNSPKPITEDINEENSSRVLYQLPTWSQDGSQLAFVRLEQTDASALTSQLLVANVDDDSVKSVYASESEHPFYLNWSPDNQNIGALTTTAIPQMLALQNIPADGEGRKILDTGSPFYWSWAPDGGSMIVHKNGPAIERASQLAFLKLDSEVIEYVLDEEPASFQAPAWAPDGSFILLTTLTEDGSQQLVLTDAQGGVQKTITDFDINVAFAWAADSEQYAYIAGTRELQNGVIGPLHVSDIHGREEIVVDESVIAFFWSPDGQEIAYLLPVVVTSEDSTEEVFYLELHILDVASGESRLIASFQPTEEFFSLVPYMDQYHQSVTLWSPDSNNIVLAFLTADGVPAIAIVPSSGVTQPRVLAEGVFATWSWK